MRNERIMKNKTYSNQRLTRLQSLKKAITILLCLSTLLGCQTPPRYPPAPKGTPNAPPQSVGLQPGDEIELKFFYTPQLDLTQRVRPDGKIQLQLVGEVEVAGKTPGELREELLGLYGIHLKDPELAVIVRSTHKQRIYVGGSVKTPGIIEMPAQLTLLEAVIEAGGFDPEVAELENVVIIRHKDGKRNGYSIDLTSMLEGNQEIQPFYLQPQDIIYVPRTRIVKLNQWIEQYINRSIPNTAGFFYTTPVGDGTIGIRND